MDDVWAQHIAGIRDRPESRMLGMMFAMATELFALKAEVKRLRLALGDEGVLAPEAELDAGEGEAFAAWLKREQGEFAAAILKPWSKADEAPDVSGIAYAEKAR